MNTLYGLKQSAFEWQQVVGERLGKLGFLPLKTDDAVYRNSVTRVVIATHVDDFLVIGKVQELINLEPQLEGLIEIKKSLRKLLIYSGQN